MTNDEKREYAEAIKHALGMGYGPPMEGEEGWVPPARRITQARTPEEDKAWLEQIEGKPIKIHVREFQSSAPARREDMEAFAAELRANPERARRFFCEAGLLSIVKDAAMTVEDADDEDLADELERTAKERAENAQAVIEAIREAKERRMAEELAKQRAKAAEPKPSTDPWAVIGKAEDDGEWLMKKIRDFG